MGCRYSACWPSRGSGDEQNLDSHPTRSTRRINVLDELGQWKERVRQIKNLEDTQPGSNKWMRPRWRNERDSQQQRRTKSEDISDSVSSNPSVSPEVKISRLESFCQKFSFKKQATVDARVDAAKSEVKEFAAAHNVELPTSQKMSYAEALGLSRRNSATAAEKTTARSVRKIRAEALARRASDPLQNAECCDLARLLSPPFEAQRQATIDKLKITDGKANEPLYTGTVDLAAKIFKVPYAALLFFDKAQVWYKAIHSSFPDLPNTAWTWLPRHMVLSSRILLLDKPRVMVVEDVMQDARFLDLVTHRLGLGQPYGFANTCFLGAAPLIAPNGYILGVLEIQDTQPRKLDAGAFNLLINLAEMTARSLLREMEEIDHSQLPPHISELNAQDSSNERPTSPLSLSSQPLEERIPSLPGMVTRAGSALEKGIVLCTVDNDIRNGRLQYVNEAFVQLTGLLAEQAVGKAVHEIFHFTEYDPEKFDDVRSAHTAAQRMTARANVIDGPEECNFRIEIKSAKAENLDQHMPDIGVPSFVELSESRNNYRYFFLLVNHAEKGSPIEKQKTASEVVKEMPNPFACHVPTLAFAAVADDERWEAQVSMGSVQISDTNSEDSKRQQSFPNKGKELLSKSSIQLPYNIEIFSNVKLGPLLGRGSFGRVHRGFWKGHMVAVKILETFKRGSMDIAEVEDIAEARLVEQMMHPNIVRTFAHGTRVKHFSGHKSKTYSPSGSKGSGQTPSHTPSSSGFVLETWLLLEYCNKGSLQDAIDRGWFKTDPLNGMGKPYLRAILGVGLEIAKGIEYLHSKQVLHSDLTPGNVLLKDAPETQYGFTVKIADFGLSRPTTSRTINTQTYGTVTHMPPELLSDGMLTKAADVYAFGVLLWSMMTGSPAWEGLRRTQVMFKVTTLKLGLPTPRDCPPCFEELLDSCMHREHRARPAMSEVVEVIEGLLHLIDDGMDLASIQWKMKRNEAMFYKSNGSVLVDVDENAPMTQESLQMNLGLPELSIDSTVKSLADSPQSESPRIKDQSLMTALPPSPSKIALNLDKPNRIELEVL